MAFSYYCKSITAGHGHDPFAMIHELNNMKQIPNLFTLLNLVFGCLAIVFTLQNGIAISGDGDGATWIDIPEKIWMASLFIGIAAVVDFLDGFVARLFKATSEMGKQLDSLADVVSFGVAPGMILYQFLRLSFAKESNSLDTSFVWLLPAFILPAAAAYRLARFNLDNSQSYSFKGMPVPAVGIFVASFPLIYWNVNEAWVQELLMNKWFLYGVIAGLSWLMVSTLPLMAMKFKDYSVKNNLPRYLLLAIAVVAILLLKWLAVPAIVLAYVIISLLFKNKIA
jgi:CDP-diacylglycerol---serine O-phosphatidyltransferase